jgi:hypothetical protein
VPTKSVRPTFITRSIVIKAKNTIIKTFKVGRTDFGSGKLAVLILALDQKFKKTLFRLLI